ncbi:Macrophage mannose receptor 1 [Oryzias melastigma]|uniref:Macrophage mannose receptor 1 n=1 Tax=Oryzias melastigma TaxID=30732 RepID=A0A834KZ91_ORYME|nr:Macrophage mannose receptor 1 [Oryzias melastigma]
MPGSRLSVLLLVSGCLQVCDLQPDVLVRRFRFVDLQRTWTEAQTYCREKFQDLATIQNLNNNTEAQQAAVNSQFWIGLFNGTWRWSQDKEEDNNPSTWFEKWSTLEPGTGSCVSISKAGAWYAKDCSTLNAFVCFSAETGQHVLVDQKKSWPDAQAHCRSQHTDLSSIRSLEENTQVSALLPDPVQTDLGAFFGALLGGTYSTSTTSTTYAWIGLHRSPWAWSDGSSAAYTQFGLLQSKGRDDCVMMDSSSSTWFWRPCTQNHTFLCNTDIRPMAMRTLKVRMSSASADLTDPVVQNSVLQQLKKRMEDEEGMEAVRLKWRMQPDGQVFSQEEGTAPPPVCQQDDACGTV